MKYKIGIMLISLFISSLLVQACGPEYRELDHTPEGFGTWTDSSDIPEELIGGWLENVAVEDKKVIMVFYADGTFKSAVLNVSDDTVNSVLTGRYSVEGNAMAVEFDYDGTSGTATFSVTGDALILNGFAYSRISDEDLVSLGVKSKVKESDIMIIKSLFYNE